MMHQKQVIDMIGKRNNMLLILSYEGKDKGGNLWKCICDCGSERVLNTSKFNQMKSCGCLLKRSGEIAAAFKHGDKGSREYIAWLNMRSRCSLSKSRKTICKHYAKRGISVCKEWDSFIRFLSDMGRSPPNGSLERIDVNGCYSKENCIWIDKRLQAQNKQSTIYCEINGRRIQMFKVADFCGVNRRTARDRVKAGWNPLIASMFLR